MAEQIQPDYSLAQQLGFYQAGGKPPGDTNADKLQKSLQTAGQAADLYEGIMNNAIAQKKAQLERQPVGNIFGVPTAQQAEAQQSTRVPENVFPQPQAQGPMNQNGNVPTTGIVPSPAPVAPMTQARQDFQAKFKGIGPDTPLSVAREALPLAAMANAKYLYANPANFSDVSISPDSTHTYAVPQKEGLNLGTKNPNVNVVTQEQAAKAGTVKKNDRILPAGASASLDGRAEALANAMITHAIPPDVNKIGGGRFGLGSMVLEKLAQKGFDYKNENLQWQQNLAGTVGLAKSLNSTQMVQLQTAFNSVHNDVEPLRQLSSQLERTGFNPVNSLIIKAGENGISLLPSATANMDQTQAQTAVKYVAQLNFMRDSMATAFVRGGVPTDRAFALTAEILNPAYSNSNMTAALDQVEKNLSLRESAFNNVAVRMPGQVTPKPATPPPNNPNEVERKGINGKVSVFDANTKKFLRYK